MQIYFLCTGNSCRSQMAEGFAKKYLSNWTVKSAGIETHGLNPKAVEVMNENGIDISAQTSDLIDLDYFNSSDLIVTLCGDAKDKCPVIPSNIQQFHWDLTDPAGQSDDVFRQVRNQIEENVKALKYDKS